MDGQAIFVMLAAGANPLFQRRIERDHLEPVVAVAIAAADRPGQPPANVLCQHDRVAGARRNVAKRFQDGA